MVFSQLALLDRLESTVCFHSPSIRGPLYKLNYVKATTCSNTSKYDAIRDNVISTTSNLLRIYRYENG